MEQGAGERQRHRKILACGVARKPDRSKSASGNDIARRWVATVEATYARTGLLYEKYDVESPAVGGGGEYEPQVGFGWTNGVTADLIDEQAG